MIRIDCAFCDSQVELDGAALPAELHCESCGVTAEIAGPAAAERILAEAA